MKWRTLRVVAATHANREESEEIVKRLMDSDIPYRYVFNSLTTKGTRCVRIFVEDKTYDKAWAALKGMSLSRPCEEV